MDKENKEYLLYHDDELVKFIEKVLDGKARKKERISNYKCEYTH